MSRILGKRVFSQFGWEAKDPRCRSGLYLGSSLLDGNYRTVWDHLDVSVRVALVSSLAFLKGGEDQLPKGLMIPLTCDGRFIQRFAYDIVKASLSEGKLDPEAAENPSQTIFSPKRNQYDIICPLPTSKGPASASNVSVAEAIASAFRQSNGSGFRVIPLIERFQPMLCKSTATDRTLRRSADAPRLMHYDNMRIDPVALENDSIRGKTILLYDDVMTWGNTTEAARNLLLMEGASEVDVITCFCTGDIFRASIYERKKDALEDSKESFVRKKSSLISKESLAWMGQTNLKEWHVNTKSYISENFPEFVPNDIPWL